MARSKFAADRGLSTRMVATMVVLAVLYVVLIAVFAVASGGTAGAWVLGVVLGLGVFWAQWYFSDKLALSAMGAREVSPAEEPQLHATIDRLCALADMPKPRVAVSQTDMPNAFAAGRSPKRAVVCVTRGIQRRLDDRELEAVLSHELSHVAHRDVLVMTIASVVGVLAGFMARMFLWTGLTRGRGSNNNAAAMVLVVMLVAAVVYLVSFLLTRLLSRYRELAADRAGAVLTGQPSMLASALTKISGDMARIPSDDLRKNEAYNTFYFVPAMTGKVDIASLFASHPPLEKRLAQLNKISVELGQG